MREPPLEVKVWGPMACFTRPENKVERVSYPIMTPSAARGVLDAIFWKPEFAYRVREIVALTPIRYVSLLRNEVTSKAGRGTEEISVTDDRAQRHTLALCGVGTNDLAYIIRADVAVKPGVDALPAKYRDQFRRRVERGQRFHQPYLGCREFACDFGPPHGDEKPISDNSDLGLMLFDIAFGNSPDGPSVPLFFNAKIERGVLPIPDYMYNQLEALRL
jgi:CRISPR-associated protein Cas5d